MWKLIGTVLGLVLLAACSSTEVERIDNGQVPVGFSTYAWGVTALAEVPEASAQLVELDDEMRGIVAGEMAARGYQQVMDPTQADMLVNYQVAVVEEAFESEDHSPSWDAQFDSNAQAGVVELPTRTDAPRVSLTLEIGRQNGPAIWGGSASKLMTRPEDKGQRRTIVTDAVRELLRDLPMAAY